MHVGEKKGLENVQVDVLKIYLRVLCTKCIAAAAAAAGEARREPDSLERARQTSPFFSLLRHVFHPRFSFR